MNEVSPLDIRTSADEVGRLLAEGQPTAALRRLDQLRQNQPLVVQEALDRYVAAENREHLEAIDRNIPSSPAIAVLRPTHERLMDSSGPPRFPSSEELEGLDAAQQFHVYASIVATRGDAQAMSELEAGNRVILGLRNETRTTDHGGRGAYDDRIVVLWQNPDNTTGLAQFHQASTEPTSQYDARAGQDPQPAPYQGSAFRRAEGLDSDRDGTPDLGRLAEGTIEMRATTHLTPGGRGTTHFSLRPSLDAVDNGAGGVHRDTNGDGWFDSADKHGIQPLNDTFKHHMGSARNTDSAGCQTLPRQTETDQNFYSSYIEAVRGTPGQERWQYVLTSTRHEPPRQHELGAEGIGNTQRQLADPRLPGHPDNTLYSQIRQHVDTLGDSWRDNADAVSLALLHSAKEKNWTSVSDIRMSHPVNGRQAGETLFLVRESGNDPADQRIGVSATTLARATTEGSLDQLVAHARDQAAHDQQQRDVDAHTQTAPGFSR